MRSLVKCASAVLAVGLTAVAAGACGERGRAAVAPGVPLSLAERRTATLTDVRYDVTFSVPDSLSERVRGREVVTFEVGEGAGPLVLDFAAPEGSVLSVRMDGDSLPYVVADQHIEIGRGTPAPGRHTVEIEFLAGDLSLNRSREFLYTLFVPDRARFALPCFDQPDIKARYRLTLEIPSGWRAVANSAVEAVDSTGARSVYRFAETAPLPTYLFAFAAGQWQLEQAERNGRTFGMYHRETDSAKVALNRDTIFDLHRLAIAFLEDYTGIAYPFDKFDFVAVPAFQYGGMEHPGGVLYRANGLLLDPTATQNQKLGRASVIAHETAHMWFGDLVTMEWFNDVWMKEVFANFMAAKIVQPAFPDINHDLRFLIAHHPAAYEIDRTAGTHAIRQELDNLNEAGTLYGAIIYQKAPIVVRQLEALIGEDTMRQGLREYLQSHRFGNASWPDLIEVLGRLSAEDLASWSRIWVEEGGRPTITTHLSVGQDGRIQSLAFTQADPHGRGRVWVQRLNVLLAYGDTARVVPLEMNAARVEVSEAAGLPAPDFVLADARGLGYGLFELDPHSRTYLLANLTSVNDPVARGTAWLTLWDGMLEAWVHPDSLLDLALRALPHEADPLIVEEMLSGLRETYWRFITPEARRAIAARVEDVLWTGVQRAEQTSLKAAYFNAYRSVALTDAAVDRLTRIWKRDLQVRGLPLAEQDYTSLAFALAVREAAGWDSILDAQAERIQNPDRREEFAFVRPATHADPAVRDSFFTSLSDPANREREPWVLEGLSLLHHPLRADSSRKYILPSLEVLEEIQRTGDIFFPLSWLSATLGGHNSPEAAQAVICFLQERPDYPPRLRNKVLQAVDPLMRAAAVLSGRSASGEDCG